MLRRLIDTNEDYAQLWLRLFLGVVFFPHGAQKALGWFGGPGFNLTVQQFTSMGIPYPFVLLAIAAEFLGALGLIFGLLSRVAAFGIACNMLVAILMVHAANGFFMNWMGNQKGEGFEYHLLVLGMTLAIMIKGSGALSIDRMITRA